MVWRALPPSLACGHDLSKKASAFMAGAFSAIGRCPPVSFLPWDLIRVSLAFSSIVVYNKSSECHCISRETLIQSQSQILQEFLYIASS